MLPGAGGEIFPPGCPLQRHHRHGTSRPENKHPHARGLPERASASLGDHQEPEVGREIMATVAGFLVWDCRRRASRSRRAGARLYNLRQKPPRQKVTPRDLSTSQGEDYAGHRETRHSQDPSARSGILIRLVVYARSPRGTTKTKSFWPNRHGGRRVLARLLFLLRPQGPCAGVVRI